MILTDEHYKTVYEMLVNSKLDNDECVRAIGDYLVPVIRNQTLEEAAEFCDSNNFRSAIGATIRALKDKVQP